MQKDLNYIQKIGVSFMLWSSCLLMINCSQQSDSIQQTQPNLLIIYPDQMRGQAMGFLQDEPVLTPQLDAFAKESLVLTNAVANFPICSPSRAMFMTGQYPHQNGVIQNCNSRSAPFGNELKGTAITWSDILKQKGYDLGFIGKWHLDSPKKPYVKTKNNEGDMKWNGWTSPDRRHGFDYWYAYGTYDYHLQPIYWTSDAARDSFHQVNQWGPEHEAKKAIDFIENKKGNLRDSNKPFALMVAMNPPHSPYDMVPEKYQKIYEQTPLDSLLKRPNIPLSGTMGGDFYRKMIKNYYAMITGVDEQFGRIVKALDDSGLKENTIVLFTSDHGNCLGIHHIPSKDYHYEESMVVPFLIRYPKKIKPRRDDILLSTPDIFPTLLDLLGYKESIPKKVMGLNLAEQILSGMGERPVAQLYMYAYAGEPDMGRRGIRTESHTLMINHRELKEEPKEWWMKNQAAPIELFDNKKDPYQLINLAETEPELLEKMRKQLKSILIKTNDPWVRHLEN